MPYAKCYVNMDKSMYRIVIISIIFLGSFSNAALANDNLQTCLSGKYHSLCNYSALTSEQRKQAKEARRLENLKTCLSGKYPTLCNHSLLSPIEQKDVAEAERQENLRTCMSGKYRTLQKSIGSDSIDFALRKLLDFLSPPLGLG